MNRFYLLLVASCLGLVLSTPSIAGTSDTTHMQSEKVLAGKTLYKEFCAKCHRPFNKTTKPQRSIERLRSSVAHFPAMKKLDFLTDDQLEALEAALATIPF